MYVVGEGIRLMVYTAVSAASPQKRSRREAEMKRVRTLRKRTKETAEDS